MTVYSWGGTTTSLLHEMKHAVHSHLSDRLTKGPGWSIEHGNDVYDIELEVHITRRSPESPTDPTRPHVPLYGSGT